jgi:glucose/arabinose dehydrogenase
MNRPCCRKPAVRTLALRRRLETLEDRVTPATISIADATAIEGSTALRFIDRFVADAGGPLLRLRGSAFGPDANADGASDFYVVAGEADAVFRYDGVTGAFLDTFVSSASGGLNDPTDLAFGPDGSLYVSGLGNHVLRYDGSNGAFLGTVASGLSTPTGLTFGPDGSLFIANQGSDEILRYSNSVLSVFVPAGSGGLDAPRQAVFGPDGNLYVGGSLTSQILLYDGQTGAFLGPFANQVSGQGGLLWLEFGADGYLYTSARTTTVGPETSLNRYHATSGAYVDTLSIGRDSWSFIVGPDNLIYFGGNGFNYIERYGPATIAAFRVSLDSASANTVSVQYTTANGTAVAGSDFTATSGTLTFAPGQTSRTILVRTLDDGLSEGSETFTVTLSNPVGATIADGQAVGTITDNEPPPRQLSIANATAVEGGATYRFTDNFVAPDGYGLAAPRGLTVGPDGNVYVSSHDTDVVKVFEGGTGRFIRNLSTPGGELDGPWAMLFGSDGLLYVSGRYSHNIVRFDTASGTSDVFVATGTGGLAVPWGIAFGPDGHLYASSVVEGAPGNTKPVKRFHGVTGAYLGDFVPAGSGGLNGPSGIAFGPDGNLYVASAGSREIKRYNGQTGAFINNFVATSPGGQEGNPGHIAFHTDGHLYVTYQYLAHLYQYSASTGQLVGAIPSPLPPEPAGGFGMAPLAFAPSGELYVGMVRGLFQPGQHVARFAPTSLAAFTVGLDAASANPVSVSFSTAPGTAVVGSDFAANSGTITFAPGETTRTILVRSLNDAVAEPHETFFVNLSNPDGAVIADGQAIGTITDDEPARVASVIVDDGTAQRSRVASLTVTFSGPVTFAGGNANAAAAFVLSRVTGGGGNVGLAAVVSINAAGQTVVALTFTGTTAIDPVSLQNGGTASLADGRYQLTILDGAVTGANGLALDGDGNGTAGGAYQSPDEAGGPGELRLYRLFGDATGNGVVDLLDLSAFRTTFNAGAGNPLYLAYLDADLNGVVDLVDLGQLRARFNGSVFAP